MGIKPFRDVDTFDYFRALIASAVREIDSLDNEYVLKASPAELEEYYVSKVIVSPLSLDGSNHYIESQKGTQMDVSHHINRFALPGKQIIVGIWAGNQKSTSSEDQSNTNIPESRHGS